MKLKNLVLSNMFLWALLISLPASLASASGAETEFKNGAARLHIRSDHSHPLDGRVLVFEYENGNQFKLSYSKTFLVWTGLGGSEDGKSEQDEYHWSEVAPKTYLVSWTEKDGTFVTTVVNLQALKVYSSGTFERNAWFWQGKITIVK